MICLNLVKHFYMIVSIKNYSFGQIEFMLIYLHFQSKPFMNLQIFAAVDSLMNDINLIDSCQAHMQYAPNIDSFARNDTGFVIDSEPHQSRTCKTIFLFAPLAVRIHTGCLAFPFYTPTKPLIQLHIKYKTVLFPKL